MYIDQTRCLGCGACIEVCPSGALRLAEGTAQVDAALCNNCRACVDACPNDAIIESLPASLPVANLPRVETSATSALRIPGEAEKRMFAPAVSAALAFLGREIVPRVAEAVVDTLANRASRAPQAASRPCSAAPTRPRQLRQRTRNQGGRSQNHV